MTEKKKKRRYHEKLTFGRVLMYVVLFMGGVIALFPFYWMITGALKTATEVNKLPPMLAPGNWFNMENFIYAFQTAPFAIYFKNSVLALLGCITTCTFTTILASYAFSRLRFPGRNTIFAMLISLMMVPYEMIIITNYRTIVGWKLHDTLWALVIPFTSSIFYTYILRNFFMSIPDSLYYSAKVDGASDWQYLWQVMVPIARPSLVTIGLLNAITCWNSFLWAVLVINTTANRTLPFGLFAFTSEAGIRYERLMAGASIVVIPMIILFLFCRKSIVTGVSKGGLKG
jgi:multiple sugar transport system permease protein